MANQIDSIEVVIQARAQEAQAALATLSRQLVTLQSAVSGLTNRLNSTGKGANTAAVSVKSYAASADTARISSTKLALAIGKVWAMFGGLRGIIRGLNSAIGYSSSLTEIQNVIDQTFGAYQEGLQEFSKTSIQNYGMSELTAKQMAGRYQAMAVAMDIPREKAAEMSVEMTKLAGDLASFYDKDITEVGESMNAVLTGMTRPMRQYGVDLTQATLKEFALKQGLDADIASMTQAEKTMLRYQYVMYATSAAQGDFQRTSQTWHNQITQLKQNFQALGSVIGTGLINALKPFVQAMNAALQGLIEFSKKVINALGKIFGWELEASSGGMALDDSIYDAADATGALGDSADGAAGSLGKAAKAAKALKTITLGIDELNINAPESPSSSSGSGSGGSGGAGVGGTGSGLASSGDVEYQLKKTEAIWEKDLSLWDVGRMISDAIRNKLEGIDWESVYEGARNFGSGLAEFLNGLIDPETFGAVGDTIAGALNAAIYAAIAFGETFDAENFGLAIATGINHFFETFDFFALGRAIAVWADNLQTTIATAVTNIKWSEVFSSIGEFFEGLGVDGIASLFGLASMAIFAKNVASFFKNTLKGAAAKGIANFAEDGQFTGYNVIPSVLLGINVAVAVLGFFDTFGNPITNKGIRWVAEQFFGTKLSEEDAQQIMDDLGISFKLKDMFRDLKMAFTGEYYELESTIKKMNFWSAVWGVFIRPGQTNGQTIAENAGNAIIDFFKFIGGKISEGTSDLSKIINDWLGSIFDDPMASLYRLGGKIIAEIGGFVADLLDSVGLDGLSAKLRDKVAEIQKAMGQQIEDGNPVGEVEIGTKNPQPQVQMDVEAARRWFSRNNKIGTLQVNAPNMTSGLSTERTKANNWLRQNPLSMWTAKPDMLTPVKSGWNTMTAWLNKNPIKVPVKSPQFKVTGTQTIQGTGTWSKVTVPKIEAFAMGGFPQGDLFIANERSPELVGTIGGRTAVSSGGEITGIRDAVNQGTATEANLLNTAIGLLRIIANNSGSSGGISQRDLFNMVEDQRKRNGYSFT